MLAPLAANGGAGVVEVLLFNNSFMPLVRLKLCRVCDQWRSSRVFTPLLPVALELRPNTEGLPAEQIHFERWW
jgi:hypothetical protein